MLATLSNPIIIDTAVVTIAKSIGVSNDSIIREHIRKTKPITNREDSSPLVYTETKTIAVQDWALRLLTVWQEVKQKYPTDNVDIEVDTIFTRFFWNTHQNLGRIR